ncbi:phosphatase 2C-like domain-containing protein, partial [Mycena amicta]
VALPAASSSEHLLALSEVSDFALTDMGHPGAGPWTYRMLPEPMLSREMERVSNARASRNVDSLSFQPCSPDVHENQDRLVVEEWSLPGGTWQFIRHVNDYTVDYVAETLPKQLKESLTRALQRSSHILPERVSQIMRDSVVQLDNSISSKFFDIFPRDLTRLGRISPQDVQNILQQDVPYITVARCLGGATVLFSLVDPMQRNLWLTNLGVLGLRHSNGTWNGTLLNRLHTTQAEAQRIRAEHPAEPHCIKHDRILGFLEPSRAVGDFWLKIPPPFTSRVFANLDQDWISQETLRRCASRISTPPYVSNIPDVYHHQLPSRPWFLLLCSDGLASAERYEEMNTATMTRHWTEVVGAVVETGSSTANAALTLLRAALGADLTSQSRNLTVEMDERWMDDITIAIQRRRA